MGSRAPAPHERETVPSPHGKGGDSAAAGAEGAFEPMALRTAPLPQDGADGATSVPPGTSFGRYLVLEKLGEGGMGEVYAAYDRTLDRKVALKLLRGDARERQPMLLREAHAMAKLSHPNVVAVFDAALVDGRLCLAMEFV